MISRRNHHMRCRVRSERGTELISSCRIATQLIAVAVVYLSWTSGGKAESPNGPSVAKTSGVVTASVRPVNFTNDVVPIFTKLGCNAGTCHAKAGGGQNGFQLSLLGFEPQEDYENITRQGRGRRLFLASPEQSLLLLKPTGRLPHGGGTRLAPDSLHYKTLLDWIRQGAPFDAGHAAQLTGIVVSPAEGVLGAGKQQQLRVVAVYADGVERDVSDLALYETASPLATVSDDGMVTAGEIPGRFSVMVRYQGKTAVFAGAIPSGRKVTEFPPAVNFIDELVFANLKQLGIPASPVCDDATFLRRVTLDIAGRIPTLQETKAFLSDDSSDKRSKLVDGLLRSTDYANYFASKWVPLLKNRRDENSDVVVNFAFHAWLRDNLLANTPYDEIVRQLLAATGTVTANPPVGWYQRVKDPKQQMEDVAQLFLGVRMQCAQCHHHPFERWSQDDYYQLVAFFSRVGRKPTGIRGQDMIIHQRGIASAVNPRTGKKLLPAALGDDIGPIAPDEDPRLRLADWMSSPDNPFFAKALVNRYWKHFFKVGLIEPEDDIRDTNPPSNPRLLAALEKHFIQSGYDLKALIRTIVLSNTYQLSSLPVVDNSFDRQNYSHFYPRRMIAEVLLDSINDVTGTQESFANLPPGTRAVALPDNSYNRTVPFLQIFGRPNSQSVCECERVQTSSLGQSLYLLNSPHIQNKLKAGGGTAATLAKAEMSDEAKIDELFLRAYSRWPTEAERRACLQVLTGDAPSSEKVSVAERTRRLGDLIWALINTKEFLFNH